MHTHTPFSSCSAAGLYYLAELIEEYSVMAKRVIASAVMVSVGIHSTLCVPINCYKGCIKFHSPPICNVVLLISSGILCVPYINSSQFYNEILGLGGCV